jgi:hypothetical protein
MVFQTIAMVFFVFTAFFGAQILKVGLMFPEDGQVESDCSDVRPLAARHADHDPPSGVPIYS